MTRSPIELTETAKNEGNIVKEFAMCKFQVAIHGACTKVDQQVFMLHCLPLQWMIGIYVISIEISIEEIKYIYDYIFISYYNVKHFAGTKFAKYVWH